MEHRAKSGHNRLSDQTRLSPSTSRWFALTVHPKHESRAAIDLTTRGFEIYLPAHRIERQWSDRVKRTEQPLFPGYLFCRFAGQDKLRVLSSPSVRSVVSIGREPVPVTDSEIKGLRELMATGRPVDVCPYIRAGERVRVHSGPFKSLHGAVIRSSRTWRVVVSVEALGCSAAIEVDADQLAPLRSSSAA